jgi:predicted transcriptional regulator
LEQSLESLRRSLADADAGRLVDADAGRLVDADAATQETWARLLKKS